MAKDVKTLATGRGSSEKSTSSRRTKRPGVFWLNGEPEDRVPVLAEKLVEWQERNRSKRSTS